MKRHGILARTVEIPAGPEEALAVADNPDDAGAGRDAGPRPKFGSGSFHLHNFLILHA